MGIHFSKTNKHDNCDNNNDNKKLEELKQITENQIELIKKQQSLIQEQEQKINELMLIIDMLKNNKIATELSEKGIVNCIDEEIMKLIEDTKKSKEYEYLVFSGGGVKGLCYCGALKILENYNIIYDKDKKLKIKGFAGASAGSIMATLLAVGYTEEELTEIMFSTDFNKFIDDKTGYIRDAINLIDDYGLCPGDFVHDFMGDLIEKKTGKKDYTFRELYDSKGIELVIVGTNMNNLKSVYFYHDNDMPIRRAVRISMSIPYLFEPIKNGDDYYVDGGVLDNYPLHVFDGDTPEDVLARLNLKNPNPKTLGFNIITDIETPNYSLVQRKEIKNVWQYSMSFIDLFLTENERRIMTPSFWKRTINIITPNYPVTDFSLTKEQKLKLYDVGKEYTKNFFGINNEKSHKDNKN